MNKALLLPLSIGLRFSHSHHRNNVVSLISIISTIGIALGVAVLIIGLSAMNGFEHELSKRILAAIPHGEIEPFDQPWIKWQDTLLKVKQIPDIVAAIPYIKFTGLLENGVNLSVVQVQGIQPQQEILISTLPSFIQNNTWKNFRSGEQQIIIGKGIADVLKVQQNDWISMIIPQENGAKKYKMQTSRKRVWLHISGIIQLRSQLDYSFAIVPLDDARKYLDMSESITGIAIKVNNLFHMEKLLLHVGKVINNNICIKSWINAYGYIYRDINMIRTIIYLVMGIVIIVACFNIASTLVMAVQDKRNDIAVLRTLGAQNSLIHAIFICYGMIIGMLGSLCGVALGILISLRSSSIIKGIENLIGHPLFSHNIYYIDFLPSELHWQNILCVLIIALLLSLLASLYPAYRAGYIDPARVLSSQ